MAERRMFAKTIISSDAFLDMPTSARLLYYDLGMRADDDGFINNARSTMRMTGASDDDMKLLVAKKFVIPFKTGIIVIKHWNMNNYIQKDRYTETKYKDEKSMLELDENKAYRIPSDTDTKRIQSVSTVETQVRLGKVSLEKESKTALESAIDDFKEFRKKINKPMTDKAVELLLIKLNKLAQDDETKIAIINESIVNSWQGVFPLKAEIKKDTEEKSRYQNMMDYDPSK
jgi:hypothetical protein